MDSAAEEAVLSAADVAELAAVLPQAARETARQPAVKIESAFFMVSSSQIYASIVFPCKIQSAKSRRFRALNFHILHNFNKKAHPAFCLWGIRTGCAVSIRLIK